MQLVLSNNRVIAHGENFLSLGGVVINTETGAKYDNATVAECEGGCPTDIDKVGYEYRGGEFVPCAPYGMGTNGNYMIACDECSTPRNSGIPIIGGMSLQLFPLLWENASPDSAFEAQTVDLSVYKYSNFIIVVADKTGATDRLQARMFDYHIDNTLYLSPWFIYDDGTEVRRKVTIKSDGITFGEGQYKPNSSWLKHNSLLIPQRIYGVKL